MIVPTKGPIPLDRSYKITEEQMKYKLWWVLDDVRANEQVGNYLKKASALRQKNRLEKKGKRVRLGVLLEQ